MIGRKTFDPKLIAKYQRRFPDFDDNIVSRYARGMMVIAIGSAFKALRSPAGFGGARAI